MTAHGTAIYGTRGGPVAPGDWGVTTQRGKTVYVHLMRAHDGRVTLPIDAPMRGTVASARLFDGGEPVKVMAGKGRIELSGLPPLSKAWDQIVALELRNV